MPNLTALITGSSRGIGKACALTLAKKGYNIILTYNKSQLQAEGLASFIKQTYSVQVLAVKVDLSKEDDIKNLVETCFKNFKTVDVLINNAGICIDKDFSDRTVSHFEKTFKTNLFGMFYLSKLVGERMVENCFGKIVNISSDNSISGFYPTTVDYDASKAGVNILTKDLAIQFAPFVNVNAVAPGWVDTDMNSNVLTDDIKNLEAQRILKRRIGTPQDVANLVSFLVSNEAEYINGEVIVINGGMF